MTPIDRLKALTPDLVDYDKTKLIGDVGSGAAVAFLSIPQGVAYAMIAGLPPKVGLYAAMIPSIIGALTRSSRHVVAGPTNAVSLLVGGAVATLAAQNGAEPVVVAATLALMVGVMQVAAGALRLGAIIDYIGAPVVLGYITGAGVLIAVGQLPNLTGTAGGSGNLLEKLSVWGQGLTQVNPLALVLGIGAAAAVVLIRKIDRRIPTAVLVMTLGIVLEFIFDFHSRGVQVLADIARVPSSLPPFSIPSVAGLDTLLPLAAATTVLSLVESSAVGRSLAARTGDRVDANREFIGQGLANVAAAFSGGYVVSGSPSRSSMCWRAGGKTRLAGVIGGLMVIVMVWVGGPILDHTPVPVLGGLLVIVAYDVIDIPRIKVTLKTTPGDAVAYIVTLIGCFSLPLDRAIYLGVGVSLVFFLRRASILVSSELAIDETGRLREVEVGDDEAPVERAPKLRIIHLEGALFFGSAGELRRILDAQVADPEVEVVILRMKRTGGMDISCATVLADAAELMRSRGMTLLVVGVKPTVYAKLERANAMERIGPENIFETQVTWFGAMDAAIERAMEITGFQCKAMHNYLAWRSSHQPLERP
ncbi:MAG: SulP family inorganic anion transporter [Myxococcota bacterium]|nr:SulP family inorganic anion transporter [Myxococcota bacterium]